MAREAVEKVKKAEEEAKALISNARNKAECIIIQAKKDAENSYNEIIAEANREAVSLKELVINEAHEEESKILSSAKIEADKLSKTDISAAVDIIVDRIVKSYVHS